MLILLSILFLINIITIYKINNWAYDIKKAVKHNLKIFS